MAAPITGFTVATPAETPDYWSLQINGTDQAISIAQALQQAVEHGLIHVGTSKINAQGWLVQVNETCATTGDYLVLGYTGATMVSIKLYNGPSGTYDNPLYSAAFG